MPQVLPIGKQRIKEVNCLTLSHILANDHHSIPDSWWSRLCMPTVPGCCLAWGASWGSPGSRPDPALLPLRQQPH